MYLAASRLAAPTSNAGDFGATTFGREAEDADGVAEATGGAWTFPAIPTPEEPDGLCTFLTVVLGFEFSF